MNAKTYANILEGMFATFIVGILALVFRGDQLIEVGGNLIFFIILSFAILPYALSFIPVQCNKLECNGRMRPRWVKGSDYELKLQYKCDHCADVYDTDFTIGLGEPGQY